MYVIIAYSIKYSINMTIALDLLIYIVTVINMVFFLQSMFISDNKIVRKRVLFANKNN